MSGESRSQGGGAAQASGDRQDMAGRLVVVTGANAGVGKATAVALARRGARVVLACRSAERGEAAREEVARASRDGAAELLLVDLAALASVRTAAAELLLRHERLDVLINNAGIWATRRQTSADGFELIFAVNQLAPFLLTHLLLPALRKSAPARIVNVASKAHVRGRMRWDDLQFERSFSSIRAYAQSKLANVLYTRELSRRLQGSGVVANSVHPGLVATELARAMPAPLRWGFRLAGLTPEQGAEGPVLLASSPALAAVSGSYFHRTHEATPSAAALDDGDAARLWQTCERLTGIA